MKKEKGKKKQNKTKKKKETAVEPVRAAFAFSARRNTTSFLSFLSLSLFLSSRPFFHARFSERKEKKFCLAPERSEETISRKQFRNERYEARVGSPGIRREGGPSMKLRTRRQSRPPVTQYMSRGGSRGNKKNRSTSTVTISYPSFFPARYLL